MSDDWIAVAQVVGRRRGDLPHPPAFRVQSPDAAHGATRRPVRKQQFALPCPGQSRHRFQGATPHDTRLALGNGRDQNLARRVGDAAHKGDVPAVRCPDGRQLVLRCVGEPDRCAVGDTPQEDVSLGPVSGTPGIGDHVPVR